MCIKCHSRLSNQKVIEDYQNFKTQIDDCKSFYELENIFIKLNSTSISHMILASLYINGAEARALSMFCLKKFIEWYKIKTNSKLYWIKKILYGLCLSKKDQYLNSIFEFNPNITYLETIYSNLSQFNRHTFMDGKYAKLSDDEYKDAFFGNTNKEENNTTTDDTNNTNDTNDTDNKNKICNDSLEMQNTIYQFIYKDVKIENNNECDCNVPNSHYLFNRNYLFIFAGIVGGIIGCYLKTI